VPAVPREGLEAGDLEIACYPQRFEAGAAVTECVLVLVADVTDTCARIGDLERKAATESAAGATAARRADEMKAALATVTEDNRGLRVEVEALRAAQLRSEAGRVEAAANLERLTETNRRLASANDELAGAIERLRGVNEELVVRTEEAQAAHEEVETLNEEFQASNEELEALNEELQATVEELSTTNNELEARNVEIADLARATQAEREKLAATLLGIGDALLAVDPEGRPLFQNPAYAETFGEGVTLCDPDGRPLPPASAPAARAARGDVFREDLTIAEPSGVVRYFEACGHPIQGPTGHAGGVVVIRDITDRSVRRLQDQFLAIASHELRTPLVPLTGYLDMLIQELEGGDPRVRRYAVQAHHELERLAGLVNDLVDVVRLRTGKLALHRAPVDLRGLLESAVAVTRGGAKVPPIEVGASGPGEPILVSADAARLEQVVINLLVNAAKHATGTPRIEVRLRRVGVAGEQAEIVVEDFGRGIAAADLPHIFQSFYQGERRDRPSRGGMGLGLFIVREIVEAHGGTVAVDSELGRGTRMTVRLPLAEAARAAPAGETKESA
jgi:two-component system CheB/CheR fusion protein